MFVVKMSMVGKLCHLCTSANVHCHEIQSTLYNSNWQKCINALMHFCQLEYYTQRAIPIDFQNRKIRSQMHLCTFYPRDAVLAPVFATATCLSVRHTPVLCVAERKQDREMYTI